MPATVKILLVVHPDDFADSVLVSIILFSRCFRDQQGPRIFQRSIRISLQQRKRKYLQEIGIGKENPFLFKPLFHLPQTDWSRVCSIAYRGFYLRHLCLQTPGHPGRADCDLKIAGIAA